MADGARRGLGAVANAVALAVLRLRPEAPTPAAPVRRVLVVELSRLGDAIQSLALAQAVRRACGSEAEVDLLVDRRWQPLLAGQIGPGRVHGASPGLAGTSRASREVAPVDLVVNASPSAANSLALVRAPARARAGYLDLRGSLTPFRDESSVVHLAQGRASVASVGRGMPLARRALPVLRMAGLAATLEAPRIVPAEASRETARSWLARNGIVRPPLVLHPTASWAHRTPSIERWSRLAARLARGTGRDLIVIGGPGERAAVRPVVEAAGKGGAALVGWPLADVAALVAASAVFVGADSGPLHLAAAVGTPAVGLYGPAPARLTTPAGLAGAALGVELDCAPCAQTRCVRLTDRCIDRLDLAEIEAVVVRLLGR